MTATIDDLHEAIDALIVRPRMRLHRDGSRTGRWHTLPSVWEQLLDAAGHAGGAGGTRAFGSRPVIATGVVTLVVEIAKGAAEATGTCRNRHGQIIPLEATKAAPNNLRAVAARLVTTPDDTDLAYWIDQVRTWVAHGRTFLRLDPEYPKHIRARCPECQATHATITDDEGKPARVPALTVNWNRPDPDREPNGEWSVRAIACQVCGAIWWRGTDLDLLVHQMLDGWTEATKTTIRSSSAIVLGKR